MSLGTVSIRSSRLSFSFLFADSRVFLPLNSDLSARLNLTREEGEKWIVTLIRDTRLEGKIDLNAVRLLSLRFFLTSTRQAHSPFSSFATQNMLHITRPYASQPPSQSILTTTRDLGSFFSLFEISFVAFKTNLPLSSPVCSCSRVRSNHELGYAAEGSDCRRSWTRWRTRWRKPREEAGGRGGTGCRGEVDHCRVPRRFGSYATIT